MQRLEVSLGERSYPITIGRGLLADFFNGLPMLQRRAIVVTNDVVGKHYLPMLERSAATCGVALNAIRIPEGESAKSWQTLYDIQTKLLETRAERKTTLIALGGGVVGDIAGFAAAIYQRGMPFVQIPTTLLSQVDSSVGGKVAVNHPLGKNMIGAFYQPRAVVIDTSTLGTLPLREVRAGLAEVIKYGLMADVTFLAWLEANVDRLLALDPEALEYAIKRSIEIKAEIVAEDERETGRRAMLNFGHTFGHAIEAGLGFGVWLHGEAVAAGMVAALRLSERLGAVSAADVERGRSLIERAGLPSEMPALGAARYWELMQLDKKVADGRVNFIVLNRLGSAKVTDSMTFSDLSQLLP